MTRRKVTEEKETEEKEMRAKAIDRDKQRIVRAAKQVKKKNEKLRKAKWKKENPKH